MRNFISPSKDEIFSLEDILFIKSDRDNPTATVLYKNGQSIQITLDTPFDWEAILKELCK